MNNVTNIDVWSETASQGSGITTAQIDEAAKNLSAKWAELEAQKNITKAIQSQCDDLEDKFVVMLEQAGKSKYIVESLGTFYFIDKMSVKTPKSIDDKRKLFDFIVENYGETFLMDKLSINSATLNKFYNEEEKNWNEQGREGLFDVPGIEAPTNMRSIGFRKAK